MSLNRFVGVGRLTADPELSYTPNGVPLAKFTVAINRVVKSENGPDADFIRVVAWRKQAENLANFMKKGSLIGIDGRIETGSYEGQDGKRVFFTNIVADNIQFLEPRNNDSNNQANNNHSNYNPNSNSSNLNSKKNNQQSQNPQNNGGGQQYQAPPQNNYTRVDEDPFANGKGPIEVSEDELPF